MDLVQMSNWYTTKKDRVPETWDSGFKAFLGGLCCKFYTRLFLAKYKTIGALLY